MKLDAKIPAGPLAQKWKNHIAQGKLVAPNNRRKYTVIVVGAGLAGSSAEHRPSSRRPWPSLDSGRREILFVVTAFRALRPVRPWKAARRCPPGARSLGFSV